MQGKFIFCVLLAALTGCDHQQLEMKSEALVESQEKNAVKHSQQDSSYSKVVDIKDLVRRPSLYVGQDIRFFMEYVSGTNSINNINEDGFTDVYAYRDPTLLSENASNEVWLRLSPKAQEKWVRSGLSRNKLEVFTVTFMATVSKKLRRLPSDPSHQVESFRIDISDFQVNSVATIYDGIREESKVELGDDMLPRNIVRLPLP